ncbi:MAG TPA: carboxypeptidase-like regulatory domain-containing protein [Pyrinomonadaceae bacterium]|nr:carboxypeptidase-like regulatory domain-containing protein [Pyrinomonadaceae bacterium]
MKAISSNLDRLRVASPCPKSWEQMTGDDRVRFCDQCQLNVYNLSALSRLEAESLIASTEGRLCGRFFRRADGTVLTTDCPVGLRALRLRVSKRAAAVFAAIASFASLGFAQESASKDKTSCTPQTKITRQNTDPKHAERSISGRVNDPNGAGIPESRVVLTRIDGKKRKETTTNEDGSFEFSHLPEGNYSLLVEHVGFKEVAIKNAELRKDQTLTIETILQPSVVYETVGILDASVYVDMTTSSVTKGITEESFRKLPVQK